MLVEYSVALDDRANVALAAATQGVYRPVWDAADRSIAPAAISIATPYVYAMQLVDSLDVADVDSERAHAYAWHDRAFRQGFSTEYQQLDTLGCLNVLGVPCPITDGGRRIDGEEAFTLALQPGREAVLITRVLAESAGTLSVYANDALIAERIIPEVPGFWVEIPTLIPAESATERTRIRILPSIQGDYLPYFHWAYQGERVADTISEPLVTTFQDGAIELYAGGIGYSVTEAGDVSIEPLMVWRTDGRARGDYKLFVHVLDSDGEIAAQADLYPGSGTLPPGNWIPGWFRERMSIRSTTPLAGRYRVVIGLYDPVTGERLIPSEGDADRRVFIGEVNIGDG
jgi:hypothetical protein